MEQEYCVIYGSTSNNPGPFIIAVSKDQTMINGFREEHYHLCMGGEIVVDQFYDNLASDFEIRYISGHYMTPVMMTAFMNYLTSVFNQVCMLVDNIDRDIDNLIFDEDEYSIVSEGFDLLREQTYGLSYTMNVPEPYGSTGDIDDSIYASILNVGECLDIFMSNYEPEDYNIY